MGLNHRATVAEIEAVLNAPPQPIEAIEAKRMKAADSPVPMQNLVELFRSFATGDHKCLVPSCPNSVVGRVKCASCTAAELAITARQEHLWRMVESGAPQFRLPDGRTDWADFKMVDAKVRNKRALKKVYALKERYAVLTGNSGMGKTIAAMAWLTREVGRGATAVWIDALDVNLAAKSKPEFDTLLHNVKTKDVVVLDDWGMELGSAVEKSGVASQRNEGMMHIIKTRFVVQKPLFVTTGQTEADLAKYYGPAFVRRVFERPELLGTVIDMGAA